MYIMEQIIVSSNPNGVVTISQEGKQVILLS